MLKFLKFLFTMNHGNLKPFCSSLLAYKKAIEREEILKQKI
jgi:hypothetical protein